MCKKGCALHLCHYLCLGKCITCLKKPMKKAMQCIFFTNKDSAVANHPHWTVAVACSCLQLSWSDSTPTSACLPWPLSPVIQTPTCVHVTLQNTNTTSALLVGTMPLCHHCSFQPMHPPQCHWCWCMTRHQWPNNNNNNTCIVCHQVELLAQWNHPSPTSLVPRHPPDCQKPVSMALWRSHQCNMQHQQCNHFCLRTAEHCVLNNDNPSKRLLLWGLKRVNWPA